MEEEVMEIDIAEGAPDTAPTPVVSAAPQIGRFERWKRDLLDITLRNPLINFRPNRAGVPLLNCDLKPLAALLSGGTQFFINPQAKGAEKTFTDITSGAVKADPEFSETLKKELEKSRLISLLNEQDLTKRLTETYRKARLMQEESGANPLFAALGFLKWQEKDKPNENRYSPLVLYPAELTRKSARAGYAVQMAGDEATANLSLIEMLRVNFKIDISALKTLPLNEGGVDIEKVFAFVREQTAEQKNWEVIEAASIGLFSFSGFVLWNDLVMREKALREHPLTGSMINNVSDPRLLMPAFESSGDPHLYLPVDADSSQIKAAADAANGKTFVLFGPPGTGKSQTITNIIGNALAHGKKVLFVAEKIAALNVVKKRLERLGLWDFCLELHSNKTQKKNFYEQFDRVLDLAANAKDVSYADAAAKLNAAEYELETFNNAVNKARAIGCSVHGAINKVISAGGAEDAIEVARVDITKEDYENGLTALKNLTDIGAALGEPVNSAFYRTSVCEYSFGLRDRVTALSKEIIKGCQDFTAAIEKLAAIVQKPKKPLDFKKFENIEKLFEAFSDAVHYAKSSGFNRFFAALFSGRYRKMRKSGFYGKLRAFIKDNAEEADGLKTALDAFMLSERGLRDMLGYGTVYQGGDDYASDIYAAAEGFAANIASLKDACIYNTEKAKCGEYPQLKEIVAEYHSGNAESGEVKALFKRSFWQSWLLAEVSADPALNTFSPAGYATKRERFKAFTNHVSDISKKEIYLKMAAKLPGFKYASVASSEPGILMRAVKSRGRGITIRGLFERIPAALQSVKPCMLMSPLSAAQYLPANFPEFDLVVFDEASQLLTCAAAGAISRGKSTVVVGDPKQLPPTTFFRSQTDDDDTDFEILDLESVLDDMLALATEQNKLLWHYRSEHESLIAFSNTNYYDGSLITFPSTDDTQSRVSFKKVEGIYDRGGTRTNPKEAAAVVDGLFEALADPERGKLSYGIVTFNITQQNLIEDLVDKRLAKEPKFEKYFTGDTPVFIKNIESVQGDERDVIIFSVTYGLDKEGKMTANFGPVNRDGGWRRLNVAITRACKQIIVYSIIMPEAIDLSKTTARGVKGLKDFMSYAVNPAQYFTRYPSAESSAFVLSVAEELKNAGFDAVANMGRSINKIDVAVKDSDGKYMLGILCDDGGTPMSASARDREYGRENFYRRMGWKITRVYALEWWQNRDAEVKRLLNILNGGADPNERGSDGGAAAEIAQQKEIAYNPDIPLPQKKYEEPNIGPCRKPEQLYVYSSAGVLNTQIKKLIEVEGPISEHILKRKLAAVWGVSRMTQKFNNQIDSAVYRFNPVTNVTQNVKFFWAALEDINMKYFRTNNGTRKPEDIPKEEFAVAALYIVQNALSISADDLTRETARLFGFIKTPAAAARIGIALDLLCAQGKIEKEGEMYKQKDLR